jgi:hypothetical protein
MSDPTFPFDHREGPDGFDFDDDERLRAVFADVPLAAQVLPETTRI